MRREEFMKQLEILLNDISEEERKEALEYYRCYFEDAGEENEERILRELESPEKVAQTIKADLELGKEKREENEARTEQVHQEERSEEKRETEMQQNGSGNGTAAAEGNNSDKAWKILLVVVIAVITSPIWVSMAGGLLGGALGLAGGLLGIVIAAIAVAGALYIAGAVIFGVGVAQLVIGNAATGIALIGSGMLVLALAILATVACVWLYGRFLPWLVRTIADLCKRVFSGRGKTE